MPSSMPKRLDHLKKLVKVYFDLQPGELINKHSEFVRIFNIKDSIHPEHPHNLMRVYISRKALKHIVESRKRELEKRHTPEQIIELVCFAIDSTKETIVNFDSYELEPPKHFYTKDYSYLGKPQLRILLEHNQERLEIVSVHFRQRKRK